MLITLSFNAIKQKNIVHKKSDLAEYQKKTNLKFSNQFEMLKHLELSHKKILSLFKFSKKNKIGFLCSVFDLDSANFIKKLNCDYIKIPSGEITNFQLLKLVGSFKKNIIISSGGSTLKEIMNAKKILNKSGLKDKKITLLHCISSYPTRIKYLNLNSIDYLKYKTGLKVGLSDHTKSTTAASYAVCKGS